ncbi:flavodoxin [Bittarella massiliensis (ex Durand et al. 2017)]|uniref:flavodoxin n=1 Tax=Bittarella massiliensis (ex Durand et al. 2017) TaxID=1720313 RepID=UPI001AA0FF72|nr:flavodoxin [Bittarella massiliensis (ex Durand et al. 2017)]
MPPRVLVAYFSATGNTETLARYAAQTLGADLYKIEPEIPYTAGDLNCSDDGSRATVEMGDAAARPAIAAQLKGMEGYDVIYLGFPIWWYLAPTIINTFLESYDFSGKVIVPFATSGGSGMGRTNQGLQASCSGADLRAGRCFRAGASRAEPKAWADGLGL